MATSRGPNQNFKLSVDLDTANDIREALEAKLKAMIETPMKELTDRQREQIGRIERTLRLEFGWNGQASSLRV